MRITFEANQPRRINDRSNFQRNFSHENLTSGFISNNVHSLATTKNIFLGPLEAHIHTNTMKPLAAELALKPVCGSRMITIACDTVGGGPLCCCINDYTNQKCIKQ